MSVPDPGGESVGARHVSPKSSTPITPVLPFLQNLDARVKVLMLLALILGIVWTPDRAWPAYPLIWLLLAVMAALSRLHIGHLMRRGGLALPFALAALPLLFTLPGQPLVELAGLTISQPGFTRFLAILLKSWLAAQTALLLTLTTPFPDLLAALSHLRVPDTLINIISFMYRYLAVLREEATSLLRARAARTTKPNRSIVFQATIAGGMVGNLFLRSYERSERIYAAMLARGYTGHIKRQDAPPLTLRAVLTGIIPVAALLIIEILVLAIR